MLTIDDLLGAALLALRLSMAGELVCSSLDLVALLLSPGLLGIWLDGVL